MAKPNLPDKPELFCVGCRRWMPRAAIAAIRWVGRPGGTQQAQYRCQPCQDAMIQRQKAVRRGG